MSGHTIPLSLRFAKYLGPMTKNGCIPWIGAKGAKGYGRIGRNGRNGGLVLAHRVAYEFKHGPIPDGLWVLHRCDNPSCVNVEHLFLGTRDDNRHDCIAKGRQVKGTRCRCSKLIAAEVISIRRRYAQGGISQDALAREFGISQSSVSWIILRKKWKHV